jgi:large subunit ribosomal protein L3
MVAGLWGKKIGMTQLFIEGKAIPVTVVDTADWYVTQLKTQENDGYCSVQVGLLKKKYQQEVFSSEWLRSKAKYFSLVKEIRLDQLPEDVVVGQKADFSSHFAQGDVVSASGKTKGCGFAGVVRRHGFRGPSASHGDTMGKRPGSIGFMRSQGRVIKGKKMPGHMGAAKHTVRGLTVVKIDSQAQLLLVRGSVPGRAGSLIFVRKADRS